MPVSRDTNLDKTMEGISRVFSGNGNPATSESISRGRASNNTKCRPGNVEAAREHVHVVLGNIKQQMKQVL